MFTLLKTLKVLLITFCLTSSVQANSKIPSIETGDSKESTKIASSNPMRSQALTPFAISPLVLRLMGSATALPFLTFAMNLFSGNADPRMVIGTLAGGTATILSFVYASKEAKARSQVAHQIDPKVRIEDYKEANNAHVAPIPSAVSPRILGLISMASFLMAGSILKDLSNVDLSKQNLGFAIVFTSLAIVPSLTAAIYAWKETKARRQVRPLKKTAKNEERLLPLTIAHQR